MIIGVDERLKRVVVQPQILELFQHLLQTLLKLAVGDRMLNPVGREVCIIEWLGTDIPAGIRG